MNALLAYSIKSVLVLTLLYTPFCILLRKERFFRQNRFTLLVILGLSLLLPLCNFSVFHIDGHNPIPFTETALKVESMGTDVVVSTVAPPSLPGTSLEPISDAGFTSFGLVQYFGYLYVIVFTILIVVRLYRLVRMHRIIRRGSLWSNEEDGIIIHCHAEDVSPCSWMRHIVISEHDYAHHHNEILLHEKAHALCYHSWDVILLMLVQSIQWYNPFIYHFSVSLRDLHEYEADEYVISQGITVQEYQYLLLKAASTDSPYIYANNFKYNLVKSRIIMMNPKVSHWWSRYKALYILPVAILLLSSFATPKDKCQLCVLYTQQIKTTDRDNLAVTDSIYSILEIGEVISKYGDLSDYSSLKNYLPVGKHTDRIKFEDCRIDANLWVYHNYPKIGTLTVHEALHPSRIYYEESTKMQQWTLLPGDTVILGYNCRRARMSYGGREWTAWYTEEIPVSSGPWKLCGLPGLILHAQDQSGTHTFSAYTVFNVDGQSIRPHSHYTYNKVKRDKFIKTRNKIKTDPQWIVKPYYNDENNASFAVLDKKDRERLNIPYFVLINGIKYPDFQFLYHYQPLELQ